MRPITDEERLLAEGSETTLHRRMWCEGCRDFTLHDVRFTGTISAAEHFIVGIARICQRVTARKSGKRRTICGLVTKDNLNVWDFNALVENDYF